MRRMSFALTERQLLAGHKTVTRRLGWLSLKAGDELLAVDKCMGLKKGQRQRLLARIRVVSVRREPLFYANEHEARAEGFPEMTGAEFVRYFSRSMNCDAMAEVTRIEFEVLEKLAPLPPSALRGAAMVRAFIDGPAPNHPKEIP